MADKMINDGNAKAKVVVEYDKDYDIKPFKETLERIATVVKDLRVPSPTLIKSLFKKVADNEVKDLKERKKIYGEIDSADVGEQFTRDEELETILSDQKKNLAKGKDL